MCSLLFFFFFSSRRRHTRCYRDWSSDVCSSDLNAALRHPAVLAQDLASLDVLSGGRLEIGIGAGWNRPEFDAIGLPFDPVAARVSRLSEAVAVLKGCFGG